MRKNDSYDRNKRIITYIKFAFLLLLIVVIPAILYIKYGSEIFSADAATRVINYLKANRNTSFLLIILLQAFQVIICILPGQPIQFAASYMFGILPGFILSIIGAVIGASISFYLAKFLGSDMMYILFDRDKVKDYQSKLNSGRGLAIVMLIYLIPGVPKDLVSYAAGISEMKFRPFIIASSIARSPGMLGSLLLGYFFSKKNYTAIIILAIAVLVLLIICLVKRKEILKMLDNMEAFNETK